MKFTIKSDSTQVTLGLNGAMLNSLKKDGIEYLWQGDPKYWSGQAPVCFPIVGTLPNNEGTAFSKPCRMKRHGVARITPFEVLEKTDDSITFIQKANDETKKAYPFEYELKIKYTVKDDTITNEYIITNNDSDKMPFSIGGHPAFNCPLLDDEKFEDYKVVFDKKMTRGILRPDYNTGLIDVKNRHELLNDSDTINLKHSYFEENDAMIFDDIESKSVTLIGPNGRGVKLEYGDMTNLLIWSACGEPNFVALEPWSGMSTCNDEDGTMENKRYITILDSGETVSYSFKIKLM